MDLRQWQRVTAASGRAPAAAPRPHRRRRRRARFHYDRARLIDSVGARGAARRRLVRPAERGAGDSPTARGTPWPRPPQCSAGAARLRRARRRDCHDGRRRRDRPDHGVARRARWDSSSSRRSAGRAKEDLRPRSPRCATGLSSALREQFGMEILKSGDRIRESVAPYSRFVRAEGDHLRADRMRSSDRNDRSARRRCGRGSKGLLRLPSTASATGTPDGPLTSTVFSGGF